MADNRVGLVNGVFGLINGTMAKSCPDGHPLVHLLRFISPTTEIG
jgi:hypothetical protein